MLPSAHARWGTEERARERERGTEGAERERERREREEKIKRVCVYDVHSVHKFRCFVAKKSLVEIKSNDTRNQ